MADSIINVIHLLATVAWIGGAVFMKAVLEPATKQIDPKEAGRLNAIVAKRFTFVAWPSLILLLVTGYLKTPEGMLFDASSQMGMILTVKHALIIVVMIVGMTIGMVVVPKMRRAMPPPGTAPSEEFLKASHQLHRLSWTSTLIGVAIIGVAAFLW